MKWVSLWWYKYLLAPKAKDIPWRTVVWCRMHGHPKGVVWYNPGELEPDMHCKTCYDDLG